MKRLAIFLMPLLLLSAGCDYQKREEEVQKREVALNQKEQELLYREKTLNIKEQELLVREQQLDSATIKDTLNAFHPALAGKWQVKMTCTETTCPGSAVGDTKIEQWEIFYQGSNIIARAMANDKLVRVYTGASNGNNIELAENAEANVPQAGTKMIVRLRIINDKSIEGQREIIRIEDCKVVYSLQLDKQ